LHEILVTNFQIEGKALEKGRNTLNKSTVKKFTLDMNKMKNM
jgi:hypothetical protein